MKKYLMSLLALVFGIGMVQANPVSVSQAKYVGQQFVQANFEQSRHGHLHPWRSLLLCVQCRQQRFRHGLRR